MSLFEPIKNRVSDAQDIVFVTGAGISQESGIPTFRGKDGLWRNHDAARLATIDAFYEDPGLVWEWYNERRKNMLGANPNAGHLAIAEMEKHANVSVLTQNIDGLHHRAKSSRVVELHGSIIKIKCTVCGFKGDSFDASIIPPKCGCGNILRPDVVWFGEQLDQSVWQEAIDLASKCDLMVIVGTSLVVSPANMLPRFARDDGATLLEINPANTEMSPLMDLTINDTGAITLSKLARILNS